MVDLKKANDLNQKINDLNEFIQIVDPEKNIIRGSGQKDIEMSLQIKKEKSVSILGKRWVGWITRDMQVEIPNELVSEIQNLARARKAVLEKELKDCLAEINDKVADGGFR